jgi:hypothetical protein
VRLCHSRCTSSPMVSALVRIVATPLRMPAQPAGRPSPGREECPPPATTLQGLITPTSAVHLPRNRRMARWRSGRTGASLGGARESTGLSSTRTSAWRACWRAALRARPRLRCAAGWSLIGPAGGGLAIAWRAERPAGVVASYRFGSLADLRLHLGHLRDIRPRPNAAAPSPGPSGSRVRLSCRGAPPRA